MFIIIRIIRQLDQLVYKYLGINEGQDIKRARIKLKNWKRMFRWIKLLHKTESLPRHPKKQQKFEGTKTLAI